MSAPRLADATIAAGAEPPRRAALPRDFFLLWSGQTVSVLGSGVTSFALGVWVFQRTGSAVHYALLSTVAALPAIVSLPFAGALVDRWNRRSAMLVADVAAAALALGLASLAWTGRLGLAAVYAVVGGTALCGALRWPAYSAAVAQLVPGVKLGNAAGLVQIGDGAAQLVGPIVGGVLLLRFGVGGVLAVDVASFAVALATLAAARVPALPPAATAGAAGSIAADVALGWRYLRERPGFLALLVDFALVNYLANVAVVLAPPMILAYAGPVQLGTVLSIGGLGLVASTVLLGVWGGPRRRVLGVMGAQLLTGVALALAGLRPSLPLAAAGAFVLFFGFGLLNGCSQALWQAKVAPAVQGRVFAVRRVVAMSTQPLAYLSAGPIGERVFEPLLAHGGPLAGTVGRVLGTGPGRGFGLLALASGAAIVCVTIAALAYPRLRRLDGELPDAGAVR